MNGTRDGSLEALGILECETIHAGMAAIDFMVKMAPVRILAADPIPPGRFLIVIGGGVAETDAAYRRGLEVAGALHDRLFLPEVHPDVLDAIRPAPPVGGDRAGDRTPADREVAGRADGGAAGSEWAEDALGLFETASVSAALDGADRGVKGSAVTLLPLHLARGIAGHGFGLFSGRQDMVEAALALAEERGRSHGRWIGSTLLARPDEALLERVRMGRWGFLRGQEIL